MLPLELSYSLPVSCGCEVGGKGFHHIIRSRQLFTGAEGPCERYYAQCCLYMCGLPPSLVVCMNNNESAQSWYFMRAAFLQVQQA
jgi:hypothetical protein